MSAWDVWRAQQRGEHGAPLPTCSTCGGVSVIDPCRSCVNTAPLPVDGRAENQASLFDVDETAS